MDLHWMIRELRTEIERLDETIMVLEALSARSREELPASRGTRGRKSMPPEERAAVSRRMKEYWRKRKA